MSSHSQPVPDAIVLQLHGELEGYALHVRQLAEHWEAQRDLVLFGDAGRAMERMRALAVAVPQLSANWLMVMISHTELMHDLWRASRGESLDTRTGLGDHLACVGDLAAQCRRLLAQGGRAVH